MGLFDRKCLNAEQLKGFDNYKVGFKLTELIEFFVFSIIALITHQLQSTFLTRFVSTTYKNNEFWNIF